MKTLPLAAAIVLAFAGSAFSQGAPNQPVPNPSAKDQSSQTQSQQPIRQQVQNDLARAGYTDIKIMPESFLVRAKDKSGNPVMMVINPDSITAVTEVNPRGPATTGSASTPGSNNAPRKNDTGAQPGNSPK
jgi:hypothetical protein